MKMEVRIERLNCCVEDLTGEDLLQPIQEAYDYMKMLFEYSDKTQNDDLRKLAQLYAQLVYKYNNWEEPMGDNSQYENLYHRMEDTYNTYLNKFPSYKWNGTEDVACSFVENNQIASWDFGDVVAYFKLNLLSN